MSDTLLVSQGTVDITPQVALEKINKFIAKSEKAAKKAALGNINSNSLSELSEENIDKLKVIQGSLEEFNNCEKVVVVVSNKRKSNVIQTQDEDADMIGESSVQLTPSGKKEKSHKSSKKRKSKHGGDEDR